MTHTTAQTKAGKRNLFINLPCPYPTSFPFQHSPDLYNSWYTIPPRNPPKKVEPATHHPQADESNSQPFDFASFVPTHDPSLSAAVDTVVEDATLPTLYTTPLTFQPPISQDQAFERAVHASYWSGYWTAIYHVRSEPPSPEANETEDQDVSSSSDEQEVEEFVSTQR